MAQDKKIKYSAPTKFVEKLRIFLLEETKNEFEVLGVTIQPVDPNGKCKVIFILKDKGA